MALFEFRLPDIGEGIAEAEIVAWHVEVGGDIAEDQPLADMMTDKATVEMESPVSGKIVALAGEVGDQVAIGATLVVIETDDDSVAEPPPAAATTVEQSYEPTSDPALVPEVAQRGPAHRGEEDWLGATSSPAEPAAQGLPLPLFNSQSPHVLASPAVRDRASALGVDLADIKASGGRVRHGDLDAYLAYGSAQGFRPAYHSAKRADEMVKVVGLRRRIADNMSASKRAIPHFTYVEEIDVTALEGMRGDLNVHRGIRPKLTVLPLLIVAICKAVPDFPMINARYDDEARVVTRHGTIHLGMATQTDAGLMVPVIRDAQDLNVWQLAREIGRLADAARSGKAKSAELTGSTLTITSLGPLGGISTTPVINRPEVAILGPNRIVERPVFANNALGNVEIRSAKLMNLSISCDHRVVDGWDAARFVQALKRLIETPALLFAPD
jgi:2-oxoisovalerate dehydrogenase E2 component (dihydrolipoyl transacylase)